MPDNINYTKINWQNGEAGGTPLNADNLDKMDSAIENLESELLEIQGSGTSALQMKQDEKSGAGDFDFTNKNPRATALDESLTGRVAYGATGDFATSFGGKSQASGRRAFSQGTTTIAKGAYSHAEGDNTVALGSDSHAEGLQTTASGQISHAEGELTLAKGKGAHAEGHYTTAEGEFSHASGFYTYANQPYQYVVGQYNNLKDGEQALFVVGNGQYDYARKNAFMVFKDGHAEVQVTGDTENSVINRKALNEVVTDINAKLEGKKSTYIIDATKTIIDIENMVNSYGNFGLKIEDAKGNNINQAIKNGEYHYRSVINSNFLSTQEKITLSNWSSQYLICLKPTGQDAMGVTSPYIETYVVDTFQNILDVGDILLIIQPEVPDRWYGGGQGDFYALESRKYEVGATNLKNQPSGSVAQKDAIYDGAAIVFSDETNGTQPGDTVPGAEVTGFQSVAFGGLRYDYVNEAENNFDRTPTSVTGNQSMAVGGSVHVNGDWSFACCKDNETYQKLAFAAGGGNRVGQTEEEFNALWNWNLNEDGQPIDADKKTYDKSSSLSAAFGETNTITRRACFATGSSNIVARDYSAAFGKGNEITAAGGTTQFVCGYYNLNNANDIFEIGNGSSSQRKNAFNITTDGKAYIGGSVTKTDAANTLTTKNYVDTNFIDKSTHPMSSDNIPCIQSSGAQIWKNISETAYWSNGQLKSWSAMMRNSAGKSEVATANVADSKYTIANKEYVDTRIPEAPNADGTYVLKCTVTNGVKKYSWIKEQ